VPRLVHLAPEKLTRRIERSGLRGSPCSVTVDGVAVEVQEAIYAMPVVPDLSITYQWARELRQWGRGRLVAVHFNVPSSEPVYVGRYGSEKKVGTAGKMISGLLQKPFGSEVLVPRRIGKSEIIRIANIRQDIGWVENPDTPHKFDCVCVACLPSGAARLNRRLRRAYEAGIAAARASATPEQIVESLRTLYLPLERGVKSLRPEPLLTFSTHPAVQVRKCAIDNLGYFKETRVENRLAESLNDPETSTQTLESLLRCAGPAVTHAHVVCRAPHLMADLAEALRYSAGSAAREILTLLSRSPDPQISRAAQEALDDD
jgi:hypothetical protein